MGKWSANLAIEHRIKEINESQVIEQTRNAETYDSRYSEFYIFLSAETLNRILKPFEDGLILDVATGTGRSLLPLLKKGYKVIGIDLTEAMLAIAKDKARETLDMDVNLIQGDALCLPFRDNSFDALVCTRFIHIMPYKAQKLLISEMGRIVKPGGMLICEFYSPFWGGFLWWTPIGRKYPKRYTWPRQIKELFSEYKIVSKIGLGLPGMNSIAKKVNFSLALYTSRWLNVFPIKHLCYQILIVARKNKQPQDNMLNFSKR